MRNRREDETLARCGGRLRGRLKYFDYFGWNLPIEGVTAADLVSRPRGSWRVVFSLSHCPRAMWWSADRNNKEISKRGAAAFLARFGSVSGPG